jgi:DNA-binding NarL/FixJ family response regulator
MSTVSSRTTLLPVHAILPDTLHSGWSQLEVYLAAADIIVHRCPEDLNQIASLCKPDRETVLFANLGFVESIQLLSSRIPERRRNAVKILVMAEDEAPSTCRRALDAGAKGILLPATDADLVIKAIATVIRGEIWVSRATLSTLAASLIHETLAAEQRQRLTAREQEILTLLAAGKNNQQIANALFISRETVRWHMRGVYSKLGTHDRELVSTFALSYPSAAERLRSRAPSDFVGTGSKPHFDKRGFPQQL